MGKKPDQIALGARLKEARTYRGFSQDDVAKFVGVSRSSISLIESGDRGVDSLELQRFAELFESSVDDLLTGEAPRAVESAAISMVARAAAKLPRSDQEEVLRFAQFLQARRRKKEDD